MSFLPRSVKPYNELKHKDALLVPFDEYCEILNMNQKDDYYIPFRNMFKQASLTLNFPDKHTGATKITYMLKFKEEEPEIPYQVKELLGYSKLGNRFTQNEEGCWVFSGYSNMEIVYKAYMFCNMTIDKYFERYEIYNEISHPKAINKNNKLYVRIDKKLIRILLNGNVYGYGLYVEKCFTQ